MDFKEKIQKSASLHNEFICENQNHRNIPIEFYEDEKMIFWQQMVHLTLNESGIKRDLLAAMASDLIHCKATKEIDQRYNSGVSLIC
jgi:hypothetical protein